MHGRAEQNEFAVRPAFDVQIAIASPAVAPQLAGAAGAFGVGAKNSGVGAASQNRDIRNPLVTNVRGRGCVDVQAADLVKEDRALVQIVFGRFEPHDAHWSAQARQAQRSCAHAIDDDLVHAGLVTLMADHGLHVQLHVDLLRH